MLLKTTAHPPECSAYRAKSHNSIYEYPHKSGVAAFMSLLRQGSLLKSSTLNPLSHLLLARSYANV
jgi:hypothetical protein